jgi:hypothetical protein
LARDNARAAEQLKASQDQLARLVARASTEQILRSKPAAPPPPPRPAVVSPPAHRPVSALPPPQSLTPQQTESRPQTTTQLQAEQPELASAPRPPMPVR